jgi:replicative DNA helicase
MNGKSISTYVPSDRLPPQNVPLEREVLSACMLPDCDLDAVLDTVTPEDFYRSAHQEIFAAVARLHARKEPVDLMTVVEDLTRAGSELKLPDLLEIAEAAPHAASAPYHAEIVRQKAVSRAVIDLAKAIMSAGYSETYSCDELVAQLQAGVSNLLTTGAGVDFADTKELLDECFAEQAARDAGEGLKIYSGLPEIDNLIGGFQGGQLVVIGARTSHGKSALSMQIFDNVASEQNKHALMFSLEISYRKLMSRIWPSRARVSRTRYDRLQLTEEDQRRLDASLPKIRGGNFFADKQFVRGVESVVSAVRRHNAKNPGLLGAVFIDYLQLMVAEDGPHRANKPRHEILSEITRRLKLLAEEVNVPIFVAAQVNREAEKSTAGLPELHHLKDSGSIEMDADIVILIHRWDRNDPNDRPGIADLNVAKNRDGETGRVEVRWKKWCTRFVSMNEPENFDPSSDSPF